MGGTRRRRGKRGLGGARRMRAGRAGAARGRLARGRPARGRPARGRAGGFVGHRWPERESGAGPAAAGRRGGGGFQGGRRGRGLPHRRGLQLSAPRRLRGGVGGAARQRPSAPACGSGGGRRGAGGSDPRPALPPPPRGSLRGQRGCRWRQGGHGLAGSGLGTQFQPSCARSGGCPVPGQRVVTGGCLAGPHLILPKTSGIESLVWAEYCPLQARVWQGLGCAGVGFSPGSAQSCARVFSESVPAFSNTEKLSVSC